MADRNLVIVLTVLGLVGFGVAGGFFAVEHLEWQACLIEKGCYQAIAPGAIEEGSRSFLAVLITDIVALVILAVAALGSLHRRLAKIPGPARTFPKSFSFVLLGYLLLTVVLPFANSFYPCRACLMLP